MKKRFVKAISLITALALLLPAVSGIGIWEQSKGAYAMNVVLEKPTIQKDNTSAMLSGQKVTWDCVYFGSYPQAEVVSSAAAYTALDAGSRDVKDIVIDPTLYTSLESSRAWGNNNELILNGVKYCRMRSTDATYKIVSGAVDGYYQWKDDITYHYFKYEDIKWRVLSTDGKKALLLSDIGLDNRYYDQSYKDVSWNNCSVRSWLNGYTAAQNQAAVNYTGKGFVDFAFNNNEANAIFETELANEQGNKAKDKVFLLSQSEISQTATAQACGFRESISYDEARTSYCSTYAKAMGVQFVIPPVGQGERLRGCGQLLRNDGKASDYTMCTLPNGQFRTEANAYASTSRMYQCYAIRPSLYLDLSKTAQYEYAGTVCSDGTVVNAQIAAAGRATLPPAATAKVTQTPTGQPAITATPGASISPIPSATATHATQQPSVSPSATAATSTQQPSVSPSAAVPTQQPSASGNPQGVQTPTPGETVVIEKTVYKGKRFTDEDTLGVYKITKTGENGTVIYLRPSDKTQRSVAIPDEVEYRDDTYRVVGVGEHAFYKNKKLRRITLGDNITKISNRAFYKCTNLQEIRFNRKLKRIGTKAFYRCNSLEEIALPSKVEHIGVRAFYKCKNLQKAVLSRDMLEIGTKSFYQCKKLRLDMRKVKKRHIAMGRKPFSGVKQVRYGNIQTRP